MNDQQRAAMQMALEALEGIYIPDGLDFIADWWPKCRDSITALREALAQTQGEWVDLTPNEVTEQIREGAADGGWQGFAQRIAAKFKEKNTPPVVPQGEPVAWIHRYKTGAEQINTAPPETYVGWSHIPLYTTPPSVEAAIEETKEKAAKVPVARLDITYGREPECYTTEVVEPVNRAMVLPVGMAFYATPQPVQQVDLTDAHILVLWQETANPDAHRIERFARAVIAKFKEKNTPVVPQGCSYCNSHLFAGTKCNNCGKVFKQQGDPIGWCVHPFDYGVGHAGVYAMTQRPEQAEAWKRKGWEVKPLYTTPPSVEAAIEATKEKAAKACKDYAEKCVEAENWEAEDVALHLEEAIRGMK